MQIAILVVCSLNLVVTTGGVLVALKMTHDAIERLEEEVDDVKERTNTSLAHVQDAIGALKF